MIQPEFLKWWYSPWRYHQLARKAQTRSDIVAMRDRYPIWCSELGIPAELPEEFDDGWCKAALLSAQALHYSVQLFSGLIAGQGKDAASIRYLPSEDRRWCIAIASTQPAKGNAMQSTGTDDEQAVLITGLTELHCHLHEGFPGLWPRMALNLPAVDGGRLESHIEAHRASSDTTAQISIFTYQRARRCWDMCHQRAERRLADLAG